MALHHHGFEPKDNVTAHYRQGLRPEACEEVVRTLLLTLLLLQTSDVCPLCDLAREQFVNRAEG